MIKYSNYAIISSFFGLWINSYLSETGEVWIGFILIFTFGILHGANDLALINNVNGKDKSLHFYKVLLYYVIIVLCGAILFYIIPWLALSLFILVSGYHFGEQQWNEKLKLAINWVKFVFQMLYGLIILFLIFTFHDKEVQKIILAITSIEVSVYSFSLVLKILFILFTLLSTFIYFKIELFKNYIFKELFFLVVFAILFKVSSLIWGFALYFIFWHSIPSIMDQMKFLFGEVSLKNFKLYFRTAFVYWILSLTGIGLLYIYFNDQKIFNALFFSFLASITFPHVVVILKMFEKK
jgi:Brp/Blh family beta-carotene 15,15'-monooxygenase